MERNLIVLLPIANVIDCMTDFERPRLLAQTIPDKILSVYE